MIKPYCYLKKISANFSIQIAALIWIFVIGVSCQEKSNTLLFQSSFESASVMTQSEQNADITGRDQSVSPPNDWVSDLEAQSRTGTFGFYYQGGTMADRYADIVEDPTASGNNVLKFWLKNGVIPRGNGKLKGRIQAELYQNADDFNEFYFTFRMYLDQDFDLVRRMKEEVDYLTLQEFWNNPDWTDEPYAYRIRLNIFKEQGAGNPLYYQVLGQRKNPSSNEWENVNKTYSVETGKWWDYLIYYKLGNQENGRFYFERLSPSGEHQVLCDVTNWTHHPDNPSPQGMRYFTPFKLYTHAEAINFVRENGGIMTLYFDDFKLYEGKPAHLATPEN